MAQVIVNSAGAVKIDTAGTPNDRLTVQFSSANRSTATVYYKNTSNVSSSSYDGTLTPGQTLTLDRQTMWFTAALAAGGGTGTGQLLTYPPPLERALLDGNSQTLLRVDGSQLELSTDHGTTWNDPGGLVFNVRDYGAKGDGVTDDTAAIQAATTAANGATLVFPSAPYNVGTAITGLGSVQRIDAAGATFTGAGAPSIASLVVRDSVQFGNLATIDRHTTRGMNLIHGRTIQSTDPEDVHGALILGSLQGIGVGATSKQVFGAEIQAQTNNVTGIAPNSMTGVNAIALHQSDGAIAAGQYIAGLNGVVQFGNTGTPALHATADLAASVRADAVQFVTAGHSVAKAIGFYAKAQTAGTFNTSIYSEGNVTTAAGAGLAIGAGFLDPTARLQVADGGMSFGTTAVSNGGVGIVTGISKLVFGYNGNAGPRIFNTGGLSLQGDNTGVRMVTTAGTNMIQITDTVIAFWGVAGIARPAAYTLNAGTLLRNLPVGATAAQIEQVLRQVITDLQGYGLLQ